MYNYSNTSDFDTMLSNITAGAVVLVLLLVLLAIAAVVLIIVSNCKIFSKAGEKGWKGLIPLYNSWVQIKISGLAWWWFLIFCVLGGLCSNSSKDGNFIYSMLLVLTSFNVNYNLAKKFGKTGGFAVLCTLLPFIGFPILAFGSAKYDKDAKVDENGIFSIK